VSNVRPSGNELPAPHATAHRLEYIDGVRALAALWVAFHHAIELSEPTSLMHIPVVGPVVGSLFFGQFPVMVFLMLSGFCLYYPYVKRTPDDPKPFSGFRPYLVRRWMRIAPPYLAAGVFCIMMAAIPATQVGRWKATGPIDASVILSHLLFVHNLIPDHATKIDYPMWSIGLEWQLYLVFPFLVYAFRRRQAVLTTLLLALLAIAIRATYRRLPVWEGAILHDGPFSYLEIFAAGMMAATITARRHRVAPSWLLGSVAIAGFAVVRFGSGAGIAHDLATAAAAFSVLLLAADPASATCRFLSTPALVRIGIFSYSLYLVHAPLLHLMWLASTRVGLAPDLTFALLVLVGMPLIVALSYGFHVCFERPFMRKKAEDAAPTQSLQPTRETAG
jgi:peptidoglycan/LPS O-acetylase OafA/YrhL